MEPEVEIWIDLAEKTWLDTLYTHAKTIFLNTPLPSHDHTHHLRVWNLSKTLLREIASFNSQIDQSLVEGVLIASFFHDLGMAYSTREDHGRLGRDHCQSWFIDSGREQPERFEEVLEAIELHDRKDVQIYTPFNRKTPPEILGILSVADDLEALGTIGIFRYAEIYLLREIPLMELGNRILQNAQTRFENLLTGCRLCKGVEEESREQYDELRLFFEQYNLQLERTSKPETVISGPLGVINYIRSAAPGKNRTEKSVKEVADYFRKLENELNHARL